VTSLNVLKEKEGSNSEYACLERKSHLFVAGYGDYSMIFKATF
jgi:hypothetical protein